MNRFLLIALVLVIGSPDCWCCLLHPLGMKEHSCCESSVVEASGCPMQRGSDGGQKTKPGECPFIQGQRDANFVSVDAPSPVMTWAAPLWMNEDFLRLESVKFTPRRVEDGGPPLERLPAFVRHHALLL